MKKRERGGGGGNTSLASEVEVSEPMALFSKKEKEEDGWMEAEKGARGAKIKKEEKRQPR